MLCERSNALVCFETYTRGTFPLHLFIYNLVDVHVNTYLHQTRSRSKASGGNLWAERSTIVACTYTHTHTVEVLIRAVCALSSIRKKEKHEQFPAAQLSLLSLRFHDCDSLLASPTLNQCHQNSLHYHPPKHTRIHTHLIDLSKQELICLPLSQG